MIDATEITIGNWFRFKQDYYHPIFEIQIKEDGFTVVSSIDYDHLLVDMLPDSYAINGYDRKYFFPIPLTPEILVENFGFKKWGRHDMPRTISYELGDFKIFPANSCCDFEGFGYMHYKIEPFKESARFTMQYVHQLQNVYYLANKYQELKLCTPLKISPKPC